MCLSPLYGQTKGGAGGTPVDTVRDLLRSLWSYVGQGKTDGSNRVGFQLPEKVINLYLASSLVSRPRPMIQGMQVHLLAGNRCIVDASIDFDALNQSESSLFSKSERKKFSGSKNVRAEIHFSLKNGFLQFEAKPIEAEVTPSQKQLEKMIRVIAADQPEKIDTGHKIPIPFGLRKFWTTDGMLYGET